jgi:ribosome recycling factor
MDLAQFKPQFEKTIEFLRQDLASLRTNRATPALLENLSVEVYGSKMPLIQLASIQSPEPRTLSVEPWDKQVIKDIEKAIQTASLGLSVANEGTFLLVTMPPMTEETRRELIKVLSHKLEQARQAVRGVRDKVKEEILQAEKNKEISEDEKYKLIEELDKLTREYIDEIQTIGDKKEDEIKL